MCVYLVRHSLHRKPGYSRQQAHAVGCALWLLMPLRMGLLRPLACGDAVAATAEGCCVGVVVVLFSGIALLVSSSASAPTMPWKIIQAAGNACFAPGSRGIQ